jgi:hypothetical protein
VRRFFNHLPRPCLIVLYSSQEKKEEYNCGDDIPVSSRKLLVIWSEHGAGRRVHSHPFHTAHIHLARLKLVDKVGDGWLPPQETVGGLLRHNYFRFLLSLRSLRNSNSGQITAYQFLKRSSCGVFLKLPLDIMHQNNHRVSRQD